MDAFSLHVELLGIGFGFPLGVGLAHDDVGLVWGPWGVELEDYAVDGLAKVVSVAHSVVLLEVLEKRFFESLWGALLVTLQMLDGSAHTFSDKSKKIFLTT